MDHQRVMNYTIFFLSCFFFIWIAACASHKKTGYDLPVTMSAVERTRFAALCSKGEILYQMNCGGCHNIKVKNQKIIPDFTQEQMSRYELKANNWEHDSSRVFARVPPGDLSNIYIFLIYKRKSNVPLVIPGHS